jgi:hypothetical protein
MIGRKYSCKHFNLRTVQRLHSWPGLPRGNSMGYAKNRMLGGQQSRSGHLIGAPTGNRNGTVGRVKPVVT